MAENISVANIISGPSIRSQNNIQPQISRRYPHIFGNYPDTCVDSCVCLVDDARPTHTTLSTNILTIPRYLGTSQILGLHIILEPNISGPYNIRSANIIGTQYYRPPIIWTPIILRPKKEEVVIRMKNKYGQQKRMTFSRQRKRRPPTLCTLKSQTHG